MKELKDKKDILIAIRQAIANINLEDDFNIDISDENIEQIENKILKLGGYYEKLGRLFNDRD